MDQYQPLVTKVALYETGQGQYWTVPGYLMLVESHDPLEPGDLARNNVHDIFLWTKEHEQKLDDLPEYKSSVKLSPAIVTDKEKIEEDDWYYWGNGQCLRKASGSPRDLSCVKVLALPGQFSRTQKKAISSRKINTLDRVYLRCHKLTDIETVDENFQTLITTEAQVRHDSEGHILIYPNQDNIANQIYELYQQLEPCPLKDHLDEWFGLHPENINTK